MPLSLAFIPSIVPTVLTRETDLDANQAAMEMTRAAPQTWALPPMQTTFITPREPAEQLSNTWAGQSYPQEQVSGRLRG